MISVILPTYNSEATIVQSIKSILHQTVVEFEILVLDDGSTDNTEGRVVRITDSRIKYVNLQHQGLTRTLNYGLSIAHFDIIARMDADDLSVPWRFERQLSMLNNLSKNTILSSWYGVFNDSTLLYFVTPPISSNEIKKGLLLHSYISHPGVMCYKETLLNNGGYCNNVAMDAFQDYETWLKIKGGIEFSIIPEVLVFQRYRKDSLSNNLNYKQSIMYSIQEPYYRDMQNNFGITSTIEENTYRGWREYFYGNKSEARKYWRRLGISIVKKPKVLLAWFVSLLPENLFIQFKETRVKFRLQYLFVYLSGESTVLRRTFKHILQSTE